MPLQEQDIPRRLIPDEITSVIRRAVAAGQLQAGERVVEAALCKSLGVSRAAAREALRQLTAEGLLVTSPHRGTYIADLTEKDVAEIYSLREALETLAVDLFVDRVVEWQLSELRDLVRKMKVALDRHDFPTVVELDMEFHETLCRFSGHGRLHEMWMRLAGQLRIFFANADPLYEDWQIIERHNQVIDAIATGDKAAAEATLREHISNAAMRLLDMRTKQDAVLSGSAQTSERQSR